MDSNFINTNYEKRLVAFIDILGFKNIIAKSIFDEQVANNLHRAMKRISEDHQNNQRDIANDDNPFNKMVTTFSDSAVISYPVQPGTGNLFSLLMEIIYLQIDLINLGFLLRGGIAIGPLYHEDSIIYGPAMIEAYYLESKIAQYPRIVLTPHTLYRAMQITRLNNVEFEQEFFKRIVTLDQSCNIYYLDVLGQGDEFDDPVDGYLSFLKHTHDIIIDGLKSTDESVHIKYKWFGIYLNHTVDQYYGSSCNNLKIPDKLLL